MLSVKFSTLLALLFITAQSKDSNTDDNLGINLKHDISNRLLSRRRLNPSDLIQSHGLDPKLSFANFKLGGIPNSLLRGDNIDDDNDGGLRRRRAASVSLARSNGKRRSDKRKDRSKKKDRKRKGKGKKSRKDRDRKDRKSKKERKDRDRRNNNKSLKSKRDRKSSRTRRNHIKPDYFKTSSRKSSRALTAAEINERLQRHNNQELYKSLSNDRRNYWLNKRINKRELNMLPSRSSKKSGKGKMSIDSYGKKYLAAKSKNIIERSAHHGSDETLDHLDSEIMGNVIDQACKVYDKLTGYCIEQELDSGCLEGDGNDGGMMGCAR